MTSPFTGEFCEVRELQRGGKEGERERERREGGERDTSRHAGETAQGWNSFTSPHRFAVL